jgi:hypothetical protein
MPSNCVKFAHDDGSVPDNLFCPRNKKSSSVMLDRLFWHPKMRCRLTAATLIEGGAA